jgi:hypothetical protein
MAQDQEKIFADGFIFKRNEKAPDFVVGRLSIKVEDAIAFMKKHEKSGWVNLNVKTARSGNYYMDLDTFQANDSSPKESAVDNYNKKAETKQQPTIQEEEEEDLPF